MKNFALTTFFIVFMILPASAQDVKFGKVSKEELEEIFYPLDSSANAAILYKKRRTFYEYSDSQGWILITKIHERIKIYNKEGYDWATKQIKLYANGENETVSIKAYTFNLVNNKIEKIKLDNSEKFHENINKYWNIKKFTMPALTPTSIVEWEYTIRSPHYGHIVDMEFQYEIPLKYINEEIKIPEYFTFKYLTSYYYPVTVKKSIKSRKLKFSFREKSNRIGAVSSISSTQNASVDLQEIIYSSVEQNIPAIKVEPFTNNINNYKSKTSFEYTAYTPKNGLHKYYSTTWEDVTKTIYKNINFGNQLDKTSYYKDDLATLIKKTDPFNEKVQKIFQFVKSKIKWNNYNNKYTTEGVIKAYKEGVGNAAEINLTLVSMLRDAGVKANPVLVSTRDNGIPLFPTSNGFNYVIACVEINNDLILLDATEKYSLPNVLPLRDLNWHGRIVREDGSSASINLLPKALSSKKVFLIVKLDQEAIVTGSSRTSFNYLNALNYRNQYNNLSEQELIGKFEENYQNIEIIDFKISNKEDISKSVKQTLTFESDNQVEMIGDNMYFSPLLYLSTNENPFKLEERKFPVDFGTPWEEKYTISIEFPEGYILESKPENVAYALPDNLGSYKFIIAEKGNSLQVLSNVKINAPIIASNNYGALKEFYKKMIDKQLEKVVLVKK